MSTETTELTLAPEANVDAMKRADNSIEVWNEYRAQLEKLKTTAETLVVTDVADKAGMKLARTTRLTLKDLRVNVEKKRKELGEEALRKKQAIDETAGEIKDAIAGLETRLLDQEQFAERKAEEELRLRVQRRTEQLAAFWNPAIPMPDLGALTVDQFDTVLADAETTHNTKIEAARKAEEEAETERRRQKLRYERGLEIAPLAKFLPPEVGDYGLMNSEEYQRVLFDAKSKEHKEQVEQERQRAENERLKKVAAVREEAARKEREAAAAEKARLDKQIADERKAAEEKAAKIKAEADAAAKVEADRQRAEEQERADILSEIQGIQQQVIIARAGRVGVREGGTIECMRETLKETEDWPIIDAHFGAFTKAAQSAKDAACAAIREMFAAEIQRLNDEERTKKEREAREKAEKELAAKKAQEEAAKRAAAEADEKAARAPDRQKLLAMAQWVENIAIPSFSSAEGIALRVEITTRVNDLRDWLKAQAERL